jgi:hypothetical protein
MKTIMEEMKDKITVLNEELLIVRAEKMKYIKEQNWEKAAERRVKEKSLLEQLKKLEEIF